MELDNLNLNNNENGAETSEQSSPAEYVCSPEQGTPEQVSAVMNSQSDGGVNTIQNLSSEQPASGAQSQHESSEYDQSSQSYSNGNHGYAPTVQSYGSAGQAYATQTQSGGQTGSSSEYRNANEYVYNGAEPARKKGSGGGKVVLGIIAAVLAVFVVSVTSISAYVYFTGNGLPSTSDTDGNVDNLIITQDGTPAALNNNQNGSEDGVDPATTTGVVSEEKSYPTLEQLAAPDDAMTLPDIYDKVSPSVVGVSCTLRNGTATGTGIIISEDGYIVTNAHVIEDALSVMIVDSEFNEYEAEVIGADTQTDIAVLKIDETGLTPCEFGKSSEVRIGELTVVIGNPLGFELYGTMTDGIISGLNRTITIGDNRMTLIQTSASINNGNSGGPLINAYGQVIGITSAKVASIYGEGLGFAIPIDDAIPIINDLIEYGYVTGRPMIGISGEDITSIMSLYYRLPQGVYVRFITPDSGADLAGIKAGDIVIGLNGETITTMSELTDAKNNFSAGDTVTLTIYRDGTSMDVEVTLSEVTAEADQ